jgi:hypothetical protein
MGLELLEFYVDFETRSAIKSQVLADFIVDWMSPSPKEEAPIEPWVIYCDGTWCKDGVGISAIIESPSRGQNEICKSPKLHQARSKHKQQHRV